MRKKILLIIALMSFIFIPGVRADENMKVIINTSFEEQIEIDKIEKIFVMIDDINMKNYNVVLKRADNFHFEIDNFPIGDVIVNSINVYRDYTIEYDYQYTITDNADGNKEIAILVVKNQKDPNRKKPHITNDDIAKILGFNPENTPNIPDITTNSTTTTTTTTDSSSNEPVEITKSTQATTENSSNNETNNKKDDRETKEETRENQDKRNKIYLFVIITILTIIIIFGAIAGFKIANANK